ncbi:MAG: hypothetical protein ACJ736_13290, partial [Streptomyces sp.]
MAPARAAAAEGFASAASVAPFHDDPAGGALVDEVEDAHDVRVVQPSGVARLAHEPSRGPIVVQARALDRDP